MRVQKVFELEPELTEALGQVRRCAEVALTQGPLSKRNALQEIIEIARKTLELE